MESVAKRSYRLLVPPEVKGRVAGDAVPPSVACDLLRMSKSNLLRMTEQKRIAAVSDARGCRWYSRTEVESLAASRAKETSEKGPRDVPTGRKARRAAAHGGELSRKPVADEQRLSGAIESLVYRDLARTPARSLVEIVTERKIPSALVLLAAESFARLSGALVLQADALAALAAREARDAETIKYLRGELDRWRPRVPQAEAEPTTPGVQ